MTFKKKYMNITIEENKKGVLLVILMLILAAFARLIPHADNFTPLGSIALFGGTYIRNKKLALVITSAAMLLGDILLQVFYGTGFHDTMIFVYGALAVITSLGFLLRKRLQIQTIMVGSLVSSLIFFFITNFGTWTTGYYGFSGDSLTNCFIAGIPFFNGTLMGDLFYNFILFGSFSLIKWRYPVLTKI